MAVAALHSAVEGRLRAFGAEFLDAFGAMNRVRERLQRIGTLPASLSTITFTGTLDTKSLPVEEMRLAAELAAELDPDTLEFEVDCDVLKRQTKRARGEHAASTNKRFRYQLPLKRLGKSVKVFHNGSVHATGCASPLEFLDMIQALCAFVRATAALDVALVDFDIQLINTLFLVVCPATGRPLTVAPGALLRHLRMHADFDTERHPSVKIPIMSGDAKVATVCVFQTGSVSIMGAKRPSHVALAYRTVCEALDACAPAVCAPDAASTMRTTTAKQPLVLVDGYPFNLHCCCQV